MNLIKKLFVYTMVFSMVFLGVGPMNIAKAVDVSAGDLVRSTTNAGVYYVYNDGGTLKRAAFPNSKTYFSWFEDFSGVKTISTDELANISYTGKLITYRPGTKMIKIDTDPKVYAVEPGGVLRWVNSEATALALYGANWATMIDDVPDAFFGWYDGSTAVDNPVTATAHPEGTLIRYEGTDDVYYIDGNGQKRMVSEAGFTANKFSEDYVVENVMDTITYTDGSAITTAEADLFPITTAVIGGVTPPAVGGDVSVSLSSSTPAEMTIPTGAPTVFTVVNFTAGSEDVNIQSLKLTMPSGILGDPTKITGITIYDGVSKIGSSKPMNSSREALFNFSTPIKVSAGTTKALTIKATITAIGRYAIGIASASDINIDGGSVSGSFPISGREMTSVVVTTMGKVEMQALTAETLSGIEFGEQNVRLAEFTLNTEKEPIIWESARFKNGGTNDPELLSNIRLMIDGDEVAQGTIDGRYINFDLNNYLIEKGDNVNVEVYGDIGIGSEGNEIKLYVDDASDFSFIGQDYGYGIAMLNTLTLTKCITVELVAGDFTISMDKTVTPAKDVLAGTDGIILATIKMTSNGEDVTVNSIEDTVGDVFYISGTNLSCDEIENIQLKDLTNGSIFDVAAVTKGAVCALSITEEMTLLKGKTHTFQLKVDVLDTADVGDTYQVHLFGAAFTITGDTSNADIAVTPTTDVASSIATVRGGALDWTTVALNDISVVGGAGSTGDPILIYRAYLKTGSASDLKLQSVKLSDKFAVDAFTNDNIAQLDLYIVENGVSRLLKSTSDYIVDADGSINFTTLNTTNRVLKKGVNVYLELRAIFTSSVNDKGTFALQIPNSSATTTYVIVQDVDNKNVVENISNPGISSREVEVVGSGDLTAYLRTDNAKANDDTYILAGSTTPNGRYLGELEFTTANEAIKITDLALENHGIATGADIKLVKLFDKDGVLVAYAAPEATGDVRFKDTDFLNGKAVLPADQKTSYFIGVEVNGMNVEGDAQSTTLFDHSIKYSFASDTILGTGNEFSDLLAGEAVKAQGVDSGEVISITNDTAAATDAVPAVGEYSNPVVINTKTASTTGAILTSIVNTMSDGALTGGNGKVVAKYKFVFDNGSNRTATNDELKAMLRELKLTIATSSGVLATNFQAYVEGNAGDTAAGSITGNVVTIDLDSGFDTNTELVDGEVTLVITANLTVGNDYQYFQSEIAALETDFTYNGDNGTGGSADWSNARLEGVTKVTGATLSKN
ncbi:MAG: hypothetical protein PHG92_04420 [Patescibacteria group bacterium]|nr:hypothetical protein [Patescibacteria group bacterium]